METTGFPVFDGDSAEYQGEEVVEHRWSDGRIDMLPVWCRDADSPTDRVGDAPVLAQAGFYRLSGSLGMGGVGFAGSTLLRLAQDLFVEVPGGDDENYGPADAFITRGSAQEVLERWLLSLAEPEFFAGPDWVDVLLADHVRLHERASGAAEGGSLPACLFPGVSMEWEACDTFVSGWIDAASSELDELLHGWRETHPWAHRVAAGQEPEATEFHERLARYEQVLADG